MKTNDIVFKFERKNETNCMIRDFYASIGKDMDSTASAIALSYLRRSVVQGNAEAIQEMQKLGKKVPYIFWHPYKKMHLEW